MATKRSGRAGSRRRRKRKNRTIPILTAVLGLVVLLILTLVIAAVASSARQTGGTGPQATQKPAWMENVQQHISPDICMAWEYRPMTLDEVPIGVNVLAPTWFYVEEDEEGRAIACSLADIGYERWQPEQYVQLAHQSGAQVWGTVVSFTPELSRQVVMEPSAQQAFLDKLEQWVTQYQLDGISFDFENMDPKNAQAFTALVEQTKKRLGADCVVSVAVTVPTASPQPNNWWQCYDRAGLSAVCDYIAIMTYDGNNGMVSPVAGLPWTKQSIELTLKEVPSGKILLGVPFYGVAFIGPRNEETNLPMWESRDGRYSITPQSVDAILQKGEYTISDTTYTVDQWEQKGVWDENECVYRYQFTDTRGNLHVLWCDDPRSMEEKGALCRTYHLGGAAVWRKGQGGPDMWQGLHEGIR